jgi:hypothetical protein
MREFFQAFHAGDSRGRFTRAFHAGVSLAATSIAGLRDARLIDFAPAT